MGKYNETSVEPAYRWRSVSAGDAFGQLTRGLYIGGAGNVHVVADDETGVTFTGVPAGTVLPVQAASIGSAGDGTTATAIIGLW